MVGTSINNALGLTEAEAQARAQAAEEAARAAEAGVAAAGADRDAYADRGGDVVAVDSGPGSRRDILNGWIAGGGGDGGAAV